MINSRDLNLLRPDVSANCRTLLARCRERGLPVLVTSTVRDDAYQEALYRQGRSRPGSIVTNGKKPTFHWVKAGLAFDICKNLRGQEYSDREFFQRVAALAKEMGFTWGGDWRTFPDKPHFQWDSGGAYTGAMVRAGRMPPEMPSFEEDEQMTQERFNEMANEYFAALADHEPSAWSAEARNWAEKNNILQGDGQGRKQYKAHCTREQMVVFLKRMADILQK